MAATSRAGSGGAHKGTPKDDCNVVRKGEPRKARKGDRSGHGNASGRLVLVAVDFLDGRTFSHLLDTSEKTFSQSPMASGGHGFLALRPGVRDETARKPSVRHRPHKPS